ncbi:MAG: TraB/GumN family protein [Novosphingobium sp.]
MIVLRWSYTLFGALFLLAGCFAPPPEKVRPALWEITDASGERGWLFGTIHALPQPVDWRSAPVDAALNNADVLALEIANGNDAKGLARTFAELAKGNDLPPVAARLPVSLRQSWNAAARRHGIDPESLRSMETWAVALTLSRHAQADSDSAFGLEAALTSAARGKRIVELEGAASQLAIFDRLPEKEQLDLLVAVIAETDDRQTGGTLKEAWATGDMAAIERKTLSGMLADPELRAALLIDRNREWSGKIADLLRTGSRPFVAVGAAHMAGPDGLPALLARQGFRIRRIQ